MPIYYVAMAEEERERKKESNRRSAPETLIIYPDTSIITWQFMENKMRH